MPHSTTASNGLGWRCTCTPVGRLGRLVPRRLLATGLDPSARPGQRRAPSTAQRPTKQVQHRLPQHPRWIPPRSRSSSAKWQASCPFQVGVASAPLCVCTRTSSVLLSPSPHPQVEPNPVPSTRLSLSLSLSLSFSLSLSLFLSFSLFLSLSLSFSLFLYLSASFFVPARLPITTLCSTCCVALSRVQGQGDQCEQPT